MGKCIVSKSNKMQCYTVYLYLETALQIWEPQGLSRPVMGLLYLYHLP
jgi:hypothetical protein